MSRNDLGSSIQNTTTLTLAVQYDVEHGTLNTTSGANPIPPPPSPSGPASTYSISVNAAGAGSNLYLYITSGQNVWGIILGCPPNKDNYFQYVYYGWAKTMSDTYNAAEGSQQYTSSQTFYAPNGSTATGTQVTVALTNVSPATGTIQFYPAPG
jgi:hypothetical protein